MFATKPNVQKPPVMMFFILSRFPLNVRIFILELYYPFYRRDLSQEWNLYIRLT